MRHLLDTTDLSIEEIDEIISLAVDIINNKKKYSKICEGKKLATLFLSQAPEQGFRLKRQCLNSAARYSAFPRQAQLPLQRAKRWGIPPELFPAMPI